MTMFLTKYENLVQHLLNAVSEAKSVGKQYGCISYIFSSVCRKLVKQLYDSCTCILFLQPVLTEFLDKVDKCHDTDNFSQFDLFHSKAFHSCTYIYHVNVLC